MLLLMAAAIIYTTARTVDDFEDGANGAELNYKGNADDDGHDEGNRDEADQVNG